MSSGDEVESCFTSMNQCTYTTCIENYHSEIQFDTIQFRRTGYMINSSNNEHEFGYP